MQFNSLIPELSVSNIEQSKEFYTKLGFKIIYERVENKFCFIQLENNQIMLEQQNENWNVGKMEYPFGRGINISMSISNIEEFYHKTIKNGFKVFLELEIHSYKVDDIVYDDKEFLIQDPDGYLLRFNN